MGIVGVIVGVFWSFWMVMLFYITTVTSSSQSYFNYK